ncbi:MAG: hypothetical protein ACRDHP_02055, partial [Ktedonobacterales bacterium]
EQTAGTTAAEPASAGSDEAAHQPSADEPGDTLSTSPATDLVPEAASVPAGADDPSEPAAATAPAWEDADTVEYNVILQRGESLDAMPKTPPPADMPALDELARAHGDVLPWPLPESIIIGGRYRVEEAVTTVPDAPGAENVYRVRDLQGYERCWSCGAEHGVEAAPDRFCQECGADMLSRDFLMTERRAESERAHADGEESGTDGEAEAGGAREERSFTQGARLYRVIAHDEEPPLFPRGVRVVAAMATDTGASRTGEENEDSAGILTLSVAYNSYTEPLTLCVVADGLGGHASGQEASRLAIRTLAEHILRTVALPHVAAPIETGEDAASVETALLVSLKAGAEAANKAICARNAA